MSRVPLGLVGAAALIACAEVGVFGGTAGEGWASSYIPANWSWCGRAAACEAADCGLLLLGNSQVKCGLQPRVIEREVGRPVVNLALVGGQAASTHHVFARAIRAGARPRAVVVGFLPGLLAPDLRINLRNWPELLDLAGCVDLIVSTGDTRLAAPLLLRAVCPSFRRRDEARAALTAALRGEPEPGRDKTRRYERNGEVNAGAHVLPKRPEFQNDLGPPGDGARWRCKPENAVYVRRFLALAAANGIPVYWLWLTVAPGLRAVRERDGRDAAYARYVRALQDEFPGLTVLDTRHLLQDPTLFSDVYHLDRRGAALLSTAVAGALAGPTPPDPVGRWVALTVPANDRSLASAEARLEALDDSAAGLDPVGRTPVPSRLADRAGRAGRVTR